MRTIPRTLLSCGLALLQACVAGGEPGTAAHPSLLFSSDELPGLRQRAATPEGVAIMSELDALLERAEKHGFAYHGPAAEHSMGNMWATGYGLRYQLSGNAGDAARAQELCRQNLFGNYYYGGGWLHTYTLLGLAVSYDLCGSAWDPEFRAMIYAYLEQNVRQLSGLPDLEDRLGTAERYRFANTQAAFKPRSPRDPQAAMFRAAAAVAAMAIASDPPPVYTPADPAQAPFVAAATNYEPWIGVPVVPFESDTMPREWLCNGPFKRGRAAAAMDAIGGMAAARPEPGMTLLSDGVAVAFRPYRPARWQGPEEPHIYARDCNRYWTSSTGGGYLPGIRLARRWQAADGFSPSLDVILYTVISNDQARVLQACPNWRSASVGNRMWINGREVRDGDLVRVEPGLYPLTVLVELVGGYSDQSPKLREYTSELYARELAVAERVRSGWESGERPVGRMRDALIAHVRDFISADLDPGDAWGFGRTQEALLPFLLVHRRVTGDTTLAALSPAAQVLPLAVRMRGHRDPREDDYAVAQGFAFMPDPYLPVGRWYLDTYGRGIRRPLDAVIALATHPVSGAVSATAPDSVFARAGVFPSYGVHVFRSGWQGAADWLFLLETGNEARSSGVEAGALYLHGLGRPWLRWHPGEDVNNANNLTIDGAWPRRAARVTKSAYQPDGSGYVTMRVDEFESIRRDDRGRGVRTGTNAPCSLQRAVVVDYGGRAGAPAVVIVVDHIAGAAFTEKTWRFDLGDVGRIGPMGSADYGLDIGPDRFLLRVNRNERTPETPAGASMSVVMVAPQRIDFVKRPYSKSPGLWLEAKLDRKITEPEKHAREAGDSLSIRSDDTLDSLLKTVETGVKADTRSTATPITVVTVISLQPGGAAPAVTVTPGAGEEKLISVGTAGYRYDGAMVTPSP